MKTIFFALPGNEILAAKLAIKNSAKLGHLQLRSFPDGETYVRLLTEVAGYKIVLVATLDRPDDKFLPLCFTAQAAKDQGALEVVLLAPYLAYLRQDKIFQPGECLTSHYFARLLSSVVDQLITVDPHLHRITKLDEVYAIPTKVLHAAGPIASWVKKEVTKPILIGPDTESEQWVAEVAKAAAAPYLILAKTRQGDWDVNVTQPQIADYLAYTPVLIDDIISTARTMIRTVAHLNSSGTQAPVCIGVHAIFAQQAYEELQASGVRQIVTCNTIGHPSNGIDLSELYLACF